MQGPAALERRDEVGRTPLHELRDALGNAPRRLAAVLGPDRTPEQIDLLATCGVDREIDEPALNLRPLVALLAREVVPVFLEGLMKDPDDEQSTAAPRSKLGELLKQVHVGAVSRRGFKKLAHFVDEDHEAAARSGIERCNRTERIEYPFLGPCRRLPFRRRQPSRRLNGLANHLCRARRDTR